MLKPDSLKGARPFGVATASLLADYVTLTKPPIILLLLITALGGIFLASEGSPPVSATLLLMIGGAAAAGGAGAINHYLDRDIDELMSRTRYRPLPGGRVSPPSAMTFGILMNIFAFSLLAAYVNLLTAALALIGTLLYVFVYTIWLKRSTPQNIVIGGAAGAVPPLAGWAAVTGSLDIPALVLFGIIFLWTPAHFWALALLIKEDYAKASVPMLPVVSGVAATRRSILHYTLALVAISLVLYVTSSVGWLYLATAVIFGAMYIRMSWRLAATNGHEINTSRRQERRLYFYSLFYLMTIFVAIMVDSVVRL